MRVKVTSSMVQGGIGVCQTSAHELESAAKDLEQSYKEAGESWHDDKYRQLGVVISNCTSTLRSPISSVETIEQNLNKLLKVIQDYEATNI